MSTANAPPRTRGVTLWRVMLIAYLPAYLLCLYWPHLSFSGPLIADLARSLPGSLSWHLHGVGHVVLTLLLIGALPQWRNGRRLAMLIAGLVVFAGLAEAAQAWVPGRSPTLLDFLFNAAGIAVALAGFLAARGFTARRPARQAECRATHCG